MADVTVYKADAVGQLPLAPKAHIHIEQELPEFRRDSDTLTLLAIQYDQDAEAIEFALIESLPGGTYDRLLGRMLGRKASHFRVAFGKD